MKKSRRPVGFNPVGPQPRGDEGRADLKAKPDETRDYLSGDFKIFQKKLGHRWSLDDLVTAYYAARISPSCTESIDLGCGLGSVMMLLAWKFETLKVTGVEAQNDRGAMARRSLAYNDLDKRCQVLDGDLRNLKTPLPKVNLVTGTPPYFPVGTGVESNKEHAAMCRFEIKGGIEEYVAAASKLLLPQGHCVVVTSALQAERVKTSARVNKLNIKQHIDIIPKAGKDVLIQVDVMSFESGVTQMETLTVRDERDQWTPEFVSIRTFFGMPVTR